MNTLFNTTESREVSKGTRLAIQNKDGGTDVWLTPPEILRALGSFDLDPCAAIEQPWSTASTMLTIEDDGFNSEWFGRVWLNPPYSEVDKWIQKLAEHRNGIALIFARTETAYFHKWIWPKADGMFFLNGRLNFYRPNGNKSCSNAGAPSVLIAYGDQNTNILKNCPFRGKFIIL